MNIIADICGWRKEIEIGFQKSTPLGVRINLDSPIKTLCMVDEPVPKLHTVTCYLKHVGFVDNLPLFQWEGN